VTDDEVSPALVQRLTAAGDTCVTVASGAAYGVSGKDITINGDDAGDYLRMLQDEQVWDSVPALKGTLPRWLALTPWSRPCRSWRPAMPSARAACCT
jgi:hypothetical protein